MSLRRGWLSTSQVDIVTRFDGVYPEVIDQWEELVRISKVDSVPQGCRFWAFESDVARQHALRAKGYRLSGDSFSLCVRRLNEEVEALLTPSNCIVRTVNPDADMEAIAVAYCAAFGNKRLTTSHFRRVMNAPTYDATPHVIVETLTPRRRIAGYAIAWLDALNSIGLIEPLAVDPKCRGRGIGRTLLTQALTRLNGAGGTKALVNVEPENAAARALYRSCGFSEWDRNLAWVKP